jgi:hypothetical protein
MSYTIRKVSVGSAIRLGVTLGWIVALGPALGLAGLAVIAIQRLNQALVQLTPFSFSFLGQELARVDILELLKLQYAAQAVGQAATHAPATFLGLAALLALAGTLGVIVVTLFLALAYNLIGRLGWGLSVDLRSDLGD